MSNQPNKPKAAARTKLSPGQSSVGRVTPTPNKKTGKGFIVRASLCMPDGSVVPIVAHGETRGIARARAHEKVDELLEAPGNEIWSASDKFGKYMERVTKPLIEELKPETRRKYMQAYKALLNTCEDETCVHQHSLADRTIAVAMKPKSLVACLHEIAALHGGSPMKSAITVLRRYVAAPMLLDELISHNPMLGLVVDWKKAKPVERPRGGRALTVEQWRAVIEYLLALDPSDVEQPTRGRYIGQVQITQRATTIDFVLAQATTGMRTTQLATRRVDEVEVDRSGTVIFWAPDEDMKGNAKGQPNPVMDPRVSQRLQERLGSLRGTYLFPAPTDPDKLWEARTRDRHIARLYRQIEAGLDVDMFEVERGHSWRTTLNTALYDVLPEATRTRLFGHTPAVNRHHYLAVTSTEAVVEAAAKVLHTSGDTSSTVIDGDSQ